MVGLLFFIFASTLGYETDNCQIRECVSVSSCCSRYVCIEHPNTLKGICVDEEQAEKHIMNSHQNASSLILDIFVDQLELQTNNSFCMNLAYYSPTKRGYKEISLKNVNKSIIIFTYSQTTDELIFTSDAKYNQLIIFNKINPFQVCFKELDEQSIAHKFQWNLKFDDMEYYSRSVLLFLVCRITFDDITYGYMEFLQPFPVNSQPKTMKRGDYVPHGTVTLFKCNYSDSIAISYCKYGNWTQPVLLECPPEWPEVYWDFVTFSPSPPRLNEKLCIEAHYYIEVGYRLKELRLCIDDNLEYPELYVYRRIDSNNDFSEIKPEWEDVLLLSNLKDNIDEVCFAKLSQNITQYKFIWIICTEEVNNRDDIFMEIENYISFNINAVELHHTTTFEMIETNSDETSYGTVEIYIEGLFQNFVPFSPSLPKINQEIHDSENNFLDISETYSETINDEDNVNESKTTNRIN